MKRLFSILNLMICLEMIVAPLVPSSRLIFSNTAMASDTCPAGQVFDNSLNRCIIADTSARAMGGAAACDKRATPELQADCFRKVAEEEKKKKAELAGEAPTISSGLDTFHNVVKTAVIGVVLSIALKKAAAIKNKCSAISYGTMIAGAAAWLVGDMYANYSHGKRLNAIESDWHKIVKPENGAEADLDIRRENSMEAQKQAFYALANKEKSLATAARQKKYFYGIAAAAFATSAGFAIYELATSSTGVAAAANYCHAEKKTEEPVLGEPSPNESPVPEGPLPEGPGEVPKTDASSWDEFVEKPAPSGTPDPGPGDHDHTPKRIDSLPRNGSWEESFNFANVDWQEEIYRKKGISNLQSAKDITSFYILSQAVNTKFSSPSLEEYENVKRYVNETQMEGSVELVNYLKEMSITMLSNLNPLSTSHATDQVLTGISDPSRSVLDGTTTPTPRPKTEGDKQKDYAVTALMLPVTFGAGAAIFSMMAGDHIPNALSSPQGRIILSFGLAGWSMIMFEHARKEQNKASARASILTKMGDDFAASAVSLQTCKSIDRNDPAKPECFCFTAENLPNPNRSNSQICQSLAPDLRGGAFADSGSPFPGCIDRSRQSDPQCACKKSSRGCLIATPRTTGGLDLGSFRMLASGLSPTDQIANGTFDSAKVSADSLANLAARITKANEKLLKDKRFKDVAIAKEKATIQFNKAINEAVGLGKPTSAGSGAAPSSPAAAIAELQKEFQENAAAQGVLGTDAGGAATAKALPEFGLDDEGQAAVNGQVAEAMKQNLDFGQNDISSGTNIFQTLSNRYQRSGMRRLFDEEGKTKADKPAATDIGK